MSQPVPAYTEEDFSRIIARDYSHAPEQARQILARYGRESFHTGQLRVQMACLKLARGNLESLEYYVGVACDDYRDVLAWAEYPAYMRARGPEQQRHAIEIDWKQLQEWLLKS